MIQRKIACLAPALTLLVAAAFPATAHDQITVAITRADCARLVEHVPAPAVAYQPGVDVHGREVASAGVDDATRLQVPEAILVEIEVNLIERFSIPANPALFDADAQIGYVVYRDGRLTFNGQPLQDEAQAELAARCQKIVRKK